jgi:hypothetical protein
MASSKHVLWRSWVWSTVIGAAFQCACEKQEAPPAPAASASVAPPEASAKPPEAPWFVGEWKAPLSIERYQIEQTKQEGKIKAWAEDAGEKATGKGEMALKIDEQGSVSGEVNGPVGKLSASGMLDGETLRVRFQPTEPDKDPADIFNGVLLAQKSADRLEGDFKVSSGDSLTVRKAAVVLSKQGAMAKAGSAAKGN